MSAGILVTGVAGFFLAMGVVALWRPERVAGGFGTPSLTRDGRNEVRAVYGGFGVAVALLLVASAWLPALRAGVLAAVAVALGGMALGRLVSAWVDGPPGWIPWLFGALELVLAAALVLAMER